MATVAPRQLRNSQAVAVLLAIQDLANLTLEQADRVNGQHGVSEDVNALKARAVGLLQDLAHACAAPLPFEVRDGQGLGPLIQEGVSRWIAVATRWALRP